MKLTHTFLIASLSAAPLWAQQVAPQAEAKGNAAGTGNATASGSASATGNGNGMVKTETHTATRQSGHHQSHGGNGMPQQAQKPVAYIGLLTRDVPPELRSQFSLADGFGLLVDEVLPDSPAKAAGLKQYDVLVKFEDQQLVNMDQFMSLVHAKKAGDVVQLGIISGGKEAKVPVTLGEHLISANDHRQHHGGNPGVPQQNGMPPFHGEQSQRGGFQNQGNRFHEQMERFQKEMQEYQKHIQEWSRGGHTGPMPQPPTLNQPGAGLQPNGGGLPHNVPQNQTGITIPPGANVQQFNFSSAANITQRDDSGEYTIKDEDGKKTFTVRPANGPEKSWPINNDAERQAVPQEFRGKLQMMDGANSGIHIEINPGIILPGNPAPQGGGNAPAMPPPVRRKTTSA